MSFCVIFCICMNIFKSIILEEWKNVEVSKKCFLLFLVQVKGWYGVIRLEEELYVSFQGNWFLVDMNLRIWALTPFILTAARDHKQQKS